MSTTTPIIDTIMSYIETQLATITVANGYRSNVKTCSRILKAIEEVGEGNFPALFPIMGREQVINQTNREVQSIFTFKVIGYVEFNEFQNSGNSAQELLIKITSDVKEKLNDLYLTNQFSSKADTFNITGVDTDEGVLEPYAAFIMECDLNISYGATNTGRIVQ